jgi:Cu2+-exporting ATPase
MSPPDIEVTFPSAGVIRLRSRSLFGDAENPTCRRFLERIFQVEEISNVTITGGDAPQADLHYCSKRFSLRGVVQRVVALLGQGAAFGDVKASASGSAHTTTSKQVNDQITLRRAATARERSTSFGSCSELEVTPVSSLSIEDDDRCTILYYRHDLAVSDWQVKSDLPGRVRLKNPALFRKNALCQAIERELMSVLGIDRFSTNSLTSTVLVHYDPHELTKAQVIEILDNALKGAEQPQSPDKLDMHLAVCTASVPLAATAQFAAAPFLPAAAALYAFTSIPTLKEARRVLVEEKRIGVDALDAVVMVGCLGTMSIFPGAVCCWCLSFGRFLVKK